MISGEMAYLHSPQGQVVAKVRCLATKQCSLGLKRAARGGFTPNDTEELRITRGDCFVAKVRLLATTQFSLGLKSAARDGFTRNDTG